MHNTPRQHGCWPPSPMVSLRQNLLFGQSGILDKCFGTAAPPNIANRQKLLVAGCTADSCPLVLESADVLLWPPTSSKDCEWFDSFHHSVVSPFDSFVTSGSIPRRLTFRSSQLHTMVAEFAPQSWRAAMMAAHALLPELNLADLTGCAGQTPTQQARKHPMQISVEIS